MLTHDQITEKVDIVAKAASQISAALVEANKIIGQPNKLREMTINVKRKADLIAGIMAEIKQDRADRLAARAAAAVPVADAPVAAAAAPATPVTPETDKAIADITATNVGVTGGPAAMADAVAAAVKK